MATPIRTVRQLSESLCIPYIDVLLPCNFCNYFLSNAEKLLFDHFDLHLVWRDNLVFGCCQGCARTVSLLEFVLYYQESYEVPEIEEILDRPLLQIELRCVTCIKKLSVAEKLEVVSNGERVHRVRNRLKAKCSLCRLYAI
ncbi:E6 protein [Human papillomavirus type 1a]|uniref:Protein E6 n=1 Tax=Human papillomavirus type 1 TaxID=10583 RepID=VE6_HPV1|nr:E6 protein [Mupapillomavirus 1]P06929.1 RecName: Full=Protein E6 [Human papillomavirus type 1a]PZQ24053.1 MAG: hypothetical protein DI558_10330 [Corynebacterium propinquum]CAA24314.1 E6 protein [Human papillomavirus type 1a]